VAAGSAVGEAVAGTGPLVAGVAAEAAWVDTAVATESRPTWVGDGPAAGGWVGGAAGRVGSEAGVGKTGIVAVDGEISSGVSVGGATSLPPGTSRPPQPATNSKTRPTKHETRNT
jgi:hypothetical protein